MRRGALPAALLGVLAVALLATAGGASPQPSPICGFCGQPFEDAADDYGVNVTVVESEVTVQVHEDGSATWTVRNRMTNGSEEFRADPSLLDDVARSAMTDRPRGVVAEPRFADARMEDDTAVLEYRDRDAAERRAGLLVVGYFHHDGYVPWHVVNADALTVRGPPGTVVFNDPASGQVEGRAVTWEGTTERPIYEAPTLSDYPYVVFGQEGSSATTARTGVALALANVPLVVERAQSFLLVQAPLFALVLALVGGAVRRRSPTVDPRPVAIGLAGLGALGGLGLAVASGPGSVPGPAVFGVVVGGLASHPRTRGALRTPRRQALVAAGALATAMAVLAILYAATGAHDDPIATAARSTALALPFAAMLPLGGALRVDTRRVPPWGVGAVLAFTAMVAVFVDFTAPLAGLGAGLFVMASFLAAIVFPVVGAFVVLLGRQLSTVELSEDTVTRRLDDV